MAWWLAYEELYGDMDKEYPIMSDKKESNDWEKVELGVGEEIYENLLPEDWRDQVGAADTVSMNFGVDSFMTGEADSGTLNLGYMAGSPAPDTIHLGGSHLPGGMGEDHISINSGYAGTAYDDPKYYATKPQPNLKYQQQKYGEDKGIADLKDYVSSTYSGHYTNGSSNVQTLALIHSVGDAESFCRSNAIKYLSRYDKKGQAKRDILKAMHYCLLLYYFSGNTNEDLTQHGYETF